MSKSVYFHCIVFVHSDLCPLDDSMEKKKGRREGRDNNARRLMAENYGKALEAHPAVTLCTHPAESEAEIPDDGSREPHSGYNHRWGLTLLAAWVESSVASHFMATTIMS